MTLLSLVEVCLCTRMVCSGARADAGHWSVGPGGYVAAIKAAQLGLRVIMLLFAFVSSLILYPLFSALRRRRVLKREVHSAELA